MAEKTGVEIELTAEDKASEKVKDLGKNLKASINPMGAVIAGLNGNFAAMGQQLLRIGQQMKLFHASMMQFTLYAALIATIVKGVKALIQHFEDAAEAKQRFQETDIESSLSNLKEDAALFAKEMEKARQIAADQKKVFEENAKSINALTLAQLEFNKAQELSIAKTKEQRAEIERRYKAEAASVNAATDSDIRANTKKGLEDERERLQAELAEAKRLSAEYEKEARRASNLALKTAKKSEAKFFSWRTLGVAFGFKPEDHTEATGNLSKQATEDYQENLEHIAELERKIELNAHELKMADIHIEAAEYQEMAEIQREINEDTEAKEEIRHETKMKNLRTEQQQEKVSLDELTKAESAARSRLAAAQSQVAKAWGWYRDKDSMKAQLEEEKAEAEAQKQYEKDFEKLRWRRDWRTAKNLSVDEEAVRRVALAKEEETAAQKAVLETAQDARRAAEALEAIEATLKGEE